MAFYFSVYNPPVIFFLTQKRKSKVLIIFKPPTLERPLASLLFLFSPLQPHQPAWPSCNILGTLAPLGFKIFFPLRFSNSPLSLDSPGFPDSTIHLCSDNLLPKRPSWISCMDDRPSYHCALLSKTALVISLVLLIIWHAKYMLSPLCEIWISQ